MSRTVVGFRVKSGFAIAVGLRGTAAAPALVARRVVALSDPAAPETRQPYHNRMFRHEIDARTIARRVRIVERCAEQSIGELLDDPAFAGCAGAALVVGSVIDPAKVGNPHIRAHASEGRLFRTALQSALESRGVPCTVVVEKELPARAAAGLNKRGSAIGRGVARLGRDAGPWRAEEKAASTAAWLLLR